MVKAWLNLMEEDAHGIYSATGKGSTFGGPHDPGDSGATASGFSTKDHPQSLYVALPAAVRQHYKFPWFCRVTVEFKGNQVRGFLADSGPGKSTGRKIDLSPRIMELLGAQTDDELKFYVDPKEIVQPAERIKPG